MYDFVKTSLALVGLLVMVAGFLKVIYGVVKRQWDVTEADEKLKGRYREALDLEKGIAETERKRFAQQVEALTTGLTSVRMASVVNTAELEGLRNETALARAAAAGSVNMASKYRRESLARIEKMGVRAGLFLARIPGMTIEKVMRWAEEDGGPVPDDPSEATAYYLVRSMREVAEVTTQLAASAGYAAVAMEEFVKAPDTTADALRDRIRERYRTGDVPGMRD